MHDLRRRRGETITVAPGEPRGWGAGPVVVHAGVTRSGVLEVHPRRRLRIARNESDINSAVTDFVKNVIPEWVRAHPAQPAHPVTQVGQVEGHRRLGAGDCE